MATANTNTPAAGAAKSKTEKGLRVVARTPGFRRAGRAFGAEPIEIRLSELNEKQIKALRDERELVVVDIDMPAAAGTEDKTE